jgi:ABC-type multidrug transport system fused ATPase/permease subunit
MKYIIALSTMLLCLVTLASAVMFWISMPTDLHGKVLAGVTATALEACKYAFFPAGIYYLKKRNIGGAGLLLIGVVLLAISVAATTGFLENAYNQQTQSVQQNSLEYQTKKQQLNSLQQQIDTLNALVAADAQGSYRSRAYENAEKVKVLEQQRDNALREIREYRQTAQGNAQSLFAALAIPLGQSPDMVRQMAFMALAVIVDVCAIAALLALGGFGTKSPGVLPLKPKESIEEISERPKLKGGSIQQQKAGELNELEKELAAKILAGTFGQPPSMRRIIQEGKVRHLIAKKIMDHLIDKKQVTREGKQYQLVQAVIL